MSTAELGTKLTAMFKETGAAHHQAFAATNGEDPDWPIFYADHLKELLGAALHTEFTRSQLIYCLMNADLSVFKQMGQMFGFAKGVFCASFSCYAACR